MNLNGAQRTILFLGIIVFSSFAIAAIPLQLNHQGVVKVSGVAFDGSGDFSFALIDGTSGNNLWTNDGTQLGTTNQPTAAVTLSVSQGLYSVNLGDTSLTNMTAIPSTVFNTNNVKMRIWFNDGSGAVQLSPDLPMTSVPYAYSADKAVLADQASAATDSVTLQGESPSDFHDATQLTGTVSSSNLPTSVMLEGENNSLLNNDAGYITSASEADTLDTVTDRGASTTNTIIVGGVVSNSVYGETVDTGQGPYELYAMDQDVQTSDSVTFAAASVGTGGAVEAEDQIQTATSTTIGWIPASCAQVFRAGLTGQLTQLKLYMEVGTAPANVLVGIYSGAAPGSGSLLSSEETVSVTYPQDSPGEVTVSFSTPVSVVASQDYYIQVTWTTASMRFTGDYSSAYAYGNAWSNLSGSYNDMSRDIYFKTYVRQDSLALNVYGVAQIQDVTNPPDTTTDRLYNNGGNLYWSGTQLDASAGDFMADGSVAMTGNLDLGGNGITNLGTDLADGDVADNLTISGGTINNDSFSAVSDLNAEGLLNNDDGADLLTRTQADGRYLQSYTEADTLDTVTGRGATTSNAVSVGALTASTVNTGQGAYELYAMNQDVETSDDVSFNTVTLSSNTIAMAQGSAPGITTDKLYNTGGNLFWNGTQLDAGGSGSATNFTKSFTVTTGGAVTAGEAVQLYSSGEIDAGNGSPFGAQQASSESTTDSYVRFTSVSDDTFVFIYTRPEFAAVAGQVSGGVITWGSLYTIDSVDPSYSLDIAKIADNRAVIVYDDGSDTTFEVIDISGTTITEAATSTSVGFNNYFGRVHSMGTDKWIAISRDSSNAAVVVGTYDSGTTSIALGSETALGACENSSSGWSVVGYSSAEAVAFYSPASNNFVAQSLSISGTTVTANSTAQLATEDANYVEACASSFISGKFYCTFYSGTSYLATGTRSGTSITTVGKAGYSKSLYNPIEKSSGSLVVGYQDYGEVAGVVFATVSGSTVTFGDERNTTISADSLYGLGALGSNDFVMGFEGGFFSGVLGTYSGTYGNLLGVANVSKAAGESAEIVLGGISANHSGLTPGSIYYSLPDGSLTTSSTSNRVGMALSSTEIVLDLQR